METQSNKLVSVIMPAYNAARFIKDSIESVRTQSYKDWELIVVDDGSVDNTKEIVSDLIETDNRIRYVYQTNSKQGKARNTGIAMAKSDLIAFIDADDLWVQDMLEKQLELINDSKTDLVFSGVKYIDESTNFTGDVHTVSFQLYEGFAGLFAFLKGNSIPIITVLTKKDALIKAGCFKVSDELQYGEDYDLWLRMLMQGSRFASHPEPLAFYRKHEKQSSKLTGTKYLQLLNIVNDLSKESLQKDHRYVIKLWLRRSMRFAKPMSHSTIRKMIIYMPSPYVRRFSLMISYILPVSILKRIIYNIIPYS